MAERDMSERERRELADAHRGEVVPGSGSPVEPRRLDQVVSLRFAPEVIATLRDIANRRGMTISDLLREGADMILLADRQTVLISDLQVTISQPSSSTWRADRHSLNLAAELDIARPLTA